MELHILPAIRARGLSQNALADALDVQKGFVSELVSGKKSPSFETFLRMCEVLRVTPNQLLGVDPIPTGFNEPAPKSLARRILENLDGPSPTTAPETAAADLSTEEIKIGTDGSRVQIIATTDRAGLDKIIRKLEALKAVLD